MLTIENRGHSLRVIHNDKLVIAHDPDNPFITVGQGEASVKAFSEGWLLKGSRAKGKTGLIYAQYDAGRSTIRFAGGDISLTFSIEELENSVVLRPQRAAHKCNRYWLSFPCRANGAIYGGGAQYRHTNLRGRSLPLWLREERFSRGLLPEVEIAGDRDASSFPQATFVTDDSVFVHIDCHSYAAFDFNNARRLIVETWDTPGAIIVGAFETPPHALKALTKITGRQPLLPNWCCAGSWMDIGGGLHNMMAQIEKAVAAKASISTLCIRDWTGLRKDTATQQPFYDWVWNQEMYPRLPDIIQQITAQGIRTLAYINPHFSIEGRLFSEASMKGYLMRKPEGGVAIHDMGGFMAGHLDLTNEDAIVWYKHIIKHNVLNLGFDGYIADLGGYFPPDVVLHSRQDPLTIHNQWPLLWAKLNREAMREAGKSNDCVFYTRAGTAGVGGFSAMVETGDHAASWGRNDGLPSALNAALSLGWSGFGVAHTPIGGTRSSLTARSKELFIRWAEFAAFTPIMRFCQGDGQQWDFASDLETGEIIARLTRVHAAMAPYIKALLRDNTANGLPLMRSMAMAFPAEKILLKNKDVYMLGGELFVAPVMEPKITKRKLILPTGLWTHIWTGQEFAGGEIEVRAPLGQPPVFAAVGGSFSRVFHDLAQL